MMCCIPKQVVELVAVIDIYRLGDYNVARNVIIDAVVWNLTVLAFALNTHVGIYFSI